MGYHTDFSGAFVVTPPLDADQVAYLQAFNDSRRMKRDKAKAALLPDPLREAVGLPIGPDGAYFVGGPGFKGQDDDDSVTDFNDPPGVPTMERSDRPFSERYAEYVAQREMAVAEGAQPGLWCQWRPTDDGELIAWDGGEKFYEYVDWLQYVIGHFLVRWGRSLTGMVEWQGEEPDDRGRMVVVDNALTVQQARITFV